MLFFTLLLLFSCSIQLFNAWRVHKQLVTHAVSAALLLNPLLSPLVSNADNSELPPVTPNKGFQTKSGVKYFDFALGAEDTPTPRYGQLISFYYNGYYRPLPEGKYEIFDSTSFNTKKPFLHKHGNGRIIRGLDEGVHTMHVGGKRRIVIPPSMGFTDVGIGPLPANSSNRKQLNKIIDNVNEGKGELIYDVELVLLADDENDQGYYDDIAISQDEVRKLVLKSLNLDTTTLKNGSPAAEVSE